MPLWIDDNGLNDPARLGALRAIGVLDEGGRARFDRLTHLAAAALRVPISLVSVVEPSRQLFVGAYGLEEPLATLREASISHSVCQYVVASGDLVEITAATSDPALASTLGTTSLGSEAYLGVPLTDPDGQILGAFCVIDHVPRAWTPADRDCIREFGQLANRELQMLRQQQALGRTTWRNASALLEHLQEAVIFIGPDGVITEWNNAAVALLGYPRDAAIGRLASRFLGPRLHGVVPRVIRQGLDASGTWSGVLPAVRDDGSRLDVAAMVVTVRDDQDQHLGYFCVANDAAGRQRLDDAMLQAQKMESLGSLAGGLAHDFNNLLSAILGSVSLMRIANTNLSSDDLESLDTVDQAARRAADITGSLLSFARGERDQHGTVDVRDVITDALKLSKFNMPRGVEVDLRLPDAPIPVRANASQVQQALINILLNAYYVMADGGTLTVEAISTGSDVRITIGDTGPGMDAETAERLWEPFFTTKPEGLGTGLGLPSTHRIITAHNGHVDIDTSPGNGTTFAIHLPLASTPRPAAASPAPAEGRILVVDDDHIVRRATLSMLERMGFAAAEAAGGDAAVALVRSDPAGWSAVLLDLVMPQKSGAEALQELNAIRADLPVIICSGYAPDRFLEADDQRYIAAILHKPFTMERLRETLARVGLLPTHPAAV